MTTDQIIEMAESVWGFSNPNASEKLIAFARLIEREVMEEVARKGRKRETLLDAHARQVEREDDES